MPQVKRVSGQQLIRALERLGWRVERIRGSHHIMRHAERARTTISVPVHGNETLPIGTQMSILRDAGVDVAEFNELV